MPAMAQQIEKIHSMLKYVFYVRRGATVGTGADERLSQQGMSQMAHASAIISRKIFDPSKDCRSKTLFLSSAAPSARISACVLEATLAVTPQFMSGLWSESPGHGSSDFLRHRGIVHRDIVSLLEKHPGAEILVILAHKEVLLHLPILCRTLVPGPVLNPDSLVHVPYSNPEPSRITPGTVIGVNPSLGYGSFTLNPCS
jgi:hypothetical protein